MLILGFEIIMQKPPKHNFQITLFTEFQLIVGRKSQCWQFHGKYLKNIVSHMNFENIVINEVLFSGRTIRFPYFPQKITLIKSSFAKFDLYFKVHFRIHLNSWPRIRNYSTFFRFQRISISQHQIYTSHKMAAKLYFMF